MNKKKLVLPGDHISSCEEAEPGESTYAENDEIYSAAIGEDFSAGGTAVIKSKGRLLQQPYVGLDVCCVIIKTSPNKAIAGCIPMSEVEKGHRGVEMEATLPVTAIRRGYVESVSREVKRGDIIKARVQKITKKGMEISIFGPEYGLVRVFCPRCRQPMDLKGEIFICSCGWKERRKIAGHATESGPSAEKFRRSSEWK